MNAITNPAQLISIDDMTQELQRQGWDLQSTYFANPQGKDVPENEPGAIRVSTFKATSEVGAPLTGVLTIDPDGITKTYGEGMLFARTVGDCAWKIGQRYQRMAASQYIYASEMLH